MTSIFEKSLRPPNGKEEIGRTDDGKSVQRSMDSLSFDQQLWSWVASGYVVIPCEVGGTVSAIELTPKFRPEIGASGYAHLLAFSFVPTIVATVADPSDTAVTIMLVGDRGPLDAMPGYINATPATISDMTAGTPYLAIFCEAVDSLSLPDRMVLK